MDLLPPGRPLAVGHRSANGLQALHEAHAAGADIVEADVWLHHGRLEVRHAKTLSPLPLLYDGPRLFPGWRPRLLLADVLAALPGQLGLMIDLKGGQPGLPAAIAAAIAPYAGAHALLVCGQDWPLLRPFSGIEGVFVLHSIGRRQQLDRVWPLLDLVENDAVSIHRDLLDAALVAELKKRVSLVMSWPVNDAATLHHLTGIGVDAVTTDNVEILREVRALRATSPAR